MINCDRTIRGSRNVIFSFMQNNDAWKLTNSNLTDSFYDRNTDEMIRVHKQYAKVIGADHYFYHGDIVGYIKSRIPNLINLRLFIQYYDLARYFLMDELCDEKYDKGLYIDIDIIPITTESLFDKMQDENSVYICSHFRKESPFCKEMETYNKILKDETYSYNGHVNNGLVGNRGHGVKNFLRNRLDKILHFIEKIDDGFEKDYIIYIGLEHYYMYMFGTTELSDLEFNLKLIKGRWNSYVLGADFPDISDVNNFERYKFLHFCGREAKEYYEKHKQEITNLVKFKLGEY